MKISTLLAFLFLSTSVFSQQLHSTLIGDYSFSGNTLDSSGYNNDGVNTGAVLVEDRFGNPNSAFLFSNGTQITLPDSMIGRYTSISISLWFNTTSFGALIGNQHFPYPQSNTHYVAPLYIGDDGLLRGKFWNGNNNNFESPNPVNDSTWHHAMLIARNDTQMLYLDFQLIATYIGYIDQLDMMDCQIGNGFVQAWPGTNGRTWMPFNGIIDDVEIRVDSVLGDTLLRPVSLSQNLNLGKPSVTIYPNPTKEFIRISKFSDVRILNQMGQLIKDERQVNYIELNDLSPGVYMVELIDPKLNQKVWRRLVVE